ncbi:MAG: hypothetical protein U9O06_06940 [Euryarchaeota archaeon]|nr:hypothetical protein [Euryarchaeota archaeon]
MAFAIVHFTVGFVSILALLWALPLTRYRLTGAFLGGIWALVPDASKILEGSQGTAVETIHDGELADLFFFHGTLDEPVFRALNIELTFLALCALGITFLLYDWRYGRHTPVVNRFGSATDPPPTDSD